MTFSTFYLPEYELITQEEIILLKPKSGGSVKAIRFDKRWRTEKRPLLWQKFLALKDEADFLRFTRQYGVLGLSVWNPLASPETKERQNQAWREMQEILALNQAAYAAREAVFSSSSPSDGVQAMERCPTLFQWSLWQAEPISFWSLQQEGLRCFVTLLNSLGCILLERHGENEVRAQIKGKKTKETLDILTKCLAIYAAQDGLIRQDNLKEKWEEIHTSPPRERMKVAMVVAQSIAGEILLRSEMTISPDAAFRWQFDAKPQTLLHCLYLDFVFDMIHKCGGLMKPCDNRDGRKPCPRFVPWGQKYHSKTCSNATAKRAERARLKQHNTKHPATRKGHKAGAS